MSQRALISVLILFCLKIASVNAQVLALDPSKTVNTATGEMGFSLPLGVVQGVNGHNFPVSLNYQAGIRSNQEASPAGLGFSYGAGEISRKVVYVPDDNVGGTANYTVTPFQACEIPNWLTNLRGFCTFASIAIGFITGGAGAALAAVGAIVGAVVGFVPAIGNSIYANSLDFSAGGTHVPQYQEAVGQGKGFFKGGEGTDLPDVYFISTPYVSGEFIWVGSAQTGNFVLKGLSDTNTVKIEKTTINIPGSALTNRMAFKVTLADGTRLIFNEIDAMPMFSESSTRRYANDAGCQTSACGRCACYYASFNGIKESTTSSWHLTAVLPPGYVDGNGDDDPLNSKNDNSGAWIGFEYTPMEFTDHYMYTGRQQINPYGTIDMCFGDPDNFSIFTNRSIAASPSQPVRMSFLRKVHTPYECAVFNYAQPYDRADRVWTSHVDGTKLREPRLAGIEFQNHAGNKKYEVEFVHDYRLKSRYYWREDDDYSTGSLSLLSLNVLAGSKTNWVAFNYAKNEPMSDGSKSWAYIPGTVGEPGYSCLHDADVESKDLWGYYFFDWGYYQYGVDDKNPDDDEQVKWNEEGNAANSDPDQWSVSNVTFSNGMTVTWEYELNRYKYVNGIIAKKVSDVPVTKYGGGPRVKKVTTNDGMGSLNVMVPGNEYTRSYFYTNERGVFTENTSNSSGYASVEPYPFNTATDPRADDKCKGGLYTSAKVGYSMVQVVDNYNEDDGTTPTGYTVYEFTHAGDPSVAGYYPNPGIYGDIDCTWKRGLLLKTAQYNKNGKMVDSTLNGYTFESHDPVDYSFPDIETQVIKSREHSGYGSSNYGWRRLDSTITFHMGVRKSDVFKYCDKNPSAKDYASVTVPRSCMKYSSTAPTMSVYLGEAHFKGCTRTAMIKGPGAYPNTAVVYVAEATSNTGPYDDDLRLQAISNVDITPGRLDLDNAQWSNVKLLSGMEDDGPWLFTGMDAIAYNDAEKNDLLLQFVEVADHANKVKLIILQNVRVEGVNIVCDDEIPLLVVFNDHGYIYGYPYFQTSSSSNPAYMDGQGATCSAVCNLDGGSIDIVLYYADHGASYIFDSDNPGSFYVLSDIDLHTQTSWRNELNDYTYNTITYDYSKSVKAHITVQDPSGNYPQIGYHACFLDLDNDGKQNDWVATDMYQENGTWRTTINDIVIKNIAVNSAAKTFTIPPTVPSLGQTTHIVKPAAGNFEQAYPLSSKTNTFGLVTPGDLSMRIYPFHFPVGATTIRTLLYGTYKAQADADLDGQPNEVWSTAPNNKCIVTKAIPAYWKYPEMGLPTTAQPNNKRMISPSCQNIVYTGPEAAGSLLREYWYNVGGISVDDFRAMLYNKPDAVDELSVEGVFDCPTNFGDNYGERIRGYITAPTTGNYTFWISSDDNSELWLSTNENPGNARKIAGIASDRWTNHNVWDTYPSQQSHQISLTGGKKYYIEVLHKEGTGGDNLSVGWQGPGITGDVERPIPLSRFTPLLTPKNVISSQATTWSNSAGNWLPSSNYSWKTDMNSSGHPIAALVDFNFASPSASNASWKYTGSIEKYDHLSTPLETKNGKGISSSVVYRNDLHLPIGTIANSKYDECAVFTCDYDMDENSFFDVQNGWKHYNNSSLPSGAICAVESVVPLTRPHFGEKSLHVKNCQAAVKTIVVHSRTAKITYSAWVRPLNDKPIRFAACLVENGTGNNAVYYDYEYNTSVIDGTWRFVKFTIDISKPVSGTLPASFDGVATANGVDGIYVWVGNHPGDPASEFYIEDIRIYPAKSLVATTYYDSKWQQPIFTVDANGNPSQKIVYDEFSRPSRWYKLNKTTATITPLQKSEYHLMGDFPGPDPNNWYRIVSMKNEDFCIELSAGVYTEERPVQLWTYPEADTKDPNVYNKMEWKFVPTGDGYYNIVGRGDPTFGIAYDDVASEAPLKLRLISGSTTSPQHKQWKLTDAGNGYCRISARLNDAALIDIKDGVMSDGTELQIFQNGANTKWKLIDVW
jgi:hypothetical protein